VLSLGAGRRAALAAALAVPALALAQAGDSARIIQYERPDREPFPRPHAAALFAEIVLGTAK